MAGYGEVQRYFWDVVMAYEGNECHIWPFAKTAGYGRMTADGKMWIVPRRVCEQAHGPAPSPDHEAAHSCGNGRNGCCTKGHLSWKTHAANQADKIEHGTSSRGECHGMNKLTMSEMLEVRSLAEGEALSQKQIASKFGITQQTVSDIKRGKSWAWLEAAA